jgi:pyruvate-ferredoxin/flavodoxin oxidoreductase
VQDFMAMETRFKMLTKSKPEAAKHLWREAQHDAESRFRLYEYLAQRKVVPEPEPKPPRP